MFSCSENSDKFGSGYFSNIQIKLDTIKIDPIGQILYLNDDIQGADISKDEKYLYNFNFYDHSLEKINLNELRLEEKLPFEKEGPNGTGQFMGRIELYSRNQLIIGDINRMELFSLEGVKLLTIRYKNFSVGLENGDQIVGNPVLDINANRLYILTNRLSDKIYSLLILNISSSEVLKVPLESFTNLNDYRFTLRVGNGSVSIDPYVRMEKFGSKLILSNQVNSDFLVFDTSIDSLLLKTYSSNLTDSGKLGNYKKEHETEKSLGDEYTKFLQDINFLPPFWDDKNQVFYRFSYQEIKGHDEKNQQKQVKVYLSAFDSNLNLLGEVQIDHLNEISNNAFFRRFPMHFVKDGNIWIYKNISDELYFIVLNLYKYNSK